MWRPRPRSKPKKSTSASTSTVRWGSTPGGRSYEASRSTTLRPPIEARFRRPWPASCLPSAFRRKKLFWYFFIQSPHFKFKLGYNVLISGCQIIGLWCGLKSVKIIFSFTISGIFFVPFIEKERFRMATNRSMSAKIPFVVAFSNTNVGWPNPCNSYYTVLSLTPRVGKGTRPSPKARAWWNALSK